MGKCDQGKYQKIAQSLTFPTGAYINGQYCEPRSAAFIQTINPATGEVIGQIANCQAADVEYAVSCARTAFNRGDWSRSAPECRKAVLLKLAELIREHSEELAVLESLDSGKPIRDCLHEIAVEVPNTFQWYAELIDKSFGKVVATGSDALSWIVKEPIGVVGLVLPWNFPLLMAAWKLAPALASGCSTIVKPAEQTSMTALRLAELATAAGIPPGVINITPGQGELAGTALGMHPDVDAISFTGSTEVGRCFMRYAAESNLKSIGLEMGGKSPFIVLEDTDITDDLIKNAVNSAFWNGGQNCSANMRQIIDRKVLDAFLDGVIKRTKAIKIGDPLDPDTEMGPMITQEHRQQVLGYIRSGRSEGADIVLGCQDSSLNGPGWFLEPTVFTNVEHSMRIAREEIFGPVLGIMPVEGIDKALTLANDTKYGLHATVYTKDLDKALYLAKRLACGTVAVNGFTEGDVKTPFGGFKQSGSLARDNGTEAMDQYLQSKTIWITTNPL